MPVCVSCRGEYEALPRETEEVREQVLACTRCGQDNRRWHKWDTASGGAHFERFFLRSIPWGYLALISFLLPLLAVAAADSIVPVASVRIGVPLAILLIFVNVALLYAIKDSLWRYDVLSRVGRGFRPSLVALGVTFFVLALIFGLALVFMMEARADDPEARPTEGLVRVLTTIMLALTFVNVTLSAMFLAAHDYSNWLDREMPQPIFAQERRLLDVIEAGVLEGIRRATGKGDQGVTTTIVELERCRDGGVDLVISAEVASNEKESLRKLQNWKITTNRWGRTKKMSQEGPQQYVELPTSDTDGADQGEEMEDDEDHGTAEQEEAEVIWERDYRSQSATCVAITSSSQHWTE
ncbi:MAG: hypothetical protein JSU72_17580 [Deltaproteobacteria bacterium]|nr:MAG: hypothetical protein JSU72_17580 [Deltaproteobacteria bacterium]